MSNNSNRVLFVFSNIPAQPQKSHTGLKNNALNSVRVLRNNGIRAGLLGINTTTDLKTYLAANPCPHVIIQALFMTNDDLDDLCSTFPAIEFAVVCHSGFPFLSPGELTLLFANMNLAAMTANLVVACNSATMCEDVGKFRRQPVTYLPNLYPVNPDQIAGGRVYQGGALRGGLFCSPRPGKNMENQAIAFGIICESLRADGTFIYNTGRKDGGQNSPATRIIQSIENTFANNPRVKTQPMAWQDKPDHLQTIGSCDLAFQVSHYETFNIVTADALVMGTPSVVSPAVRWAPDSWKAQPDSATDIARVGMSLLYGVTAVADGLTALQSHNAGSLHAWRAYLFDGVANVGANAFVSTATRQQSIHAPHKPAGHA